MLNDILISFFSLSGIASLFLGTILGFIIGIMPGLGQGAALTLVLPVAFVLPSEIAFILFASVLGSSLAGGSVTSILLNTPGTVGNMTTLLDGYPMARSGQASRALGIAAGSSIVGALLGVLVLVIALPGVRLLLMYFGAQEYFWAVVVSLIIIALSGMGQSFLPGLVSGFTGLLISFIGFSNMTMLTRYTGGVLYLWDGLPLVALAIGTAALSELTRLQAGGTSIAEKSDTNNVSLRDIFKGALEALNHKACILRSSVIGAIIGVIPGLGSVAATYVSYSATTAIDKDKESYGTGNPKGIIAAEAANNAKDGGAMLPTLFLGIPGSPEHAILLMIFIIYGIEPGPGMGIEHMNLVWTIILSIALSNIIACFIQLFGGRFLSKITVVPITPVVAVTIPLSVVAVQITRGNPWDILVAGIFIIVGIMLKRTGYPMGPLVVGFVLGPLLEKSFYMSLQSGLYDPMTFFHSPLSISLAVVAALGFLAPLIIRVVQLMRDKRSTESKAVHYESADDLSSRGKNKPGRKDWLAFTGFLLAMSLMFVLVAPKYSVHDAALPFGVGLINAFILIFLLLGELSPKADLLQHRILGGFAGRGRWNPKTAWKKLVPAILWVFIFLVLFIAFGALLSTLVFVFVLMLSFGKNSWKKSLVTALIVTGFIYVAFEIALNLQLWYGAVPEIIPGFIGGDRLPPLI